MKKLLAVVPFALAAAVAFPVAATAGGNNESARAHFTLFSFTSIDVSARASLLNTNASGSYKDTRTNTDPNIVIYGDVTCLDVEPGRTAIVSGVVTRIEPSPSVFGTPAPNTFMITLKDNGSGSSQLAPDMSSFPQYFTSPTPPTNGACGAPSFLSPITSGEIVVEPVK